MPPRSVGDLAQALPENERKDLLARIQKSLSLHQKNDEDLVKTTTPIEQKSQFVKEGINRLSLGQRFYLWFLRVFQNKSEEQAYMSIKMNELAKQIEGQHLVDTTLRTLEPEFARQIYKLYLHVIPVRNFIGHVWSSEDDLKNAIQYVIEQRVPRAKSSFRDFLAIDEIQVLYEMSESKATIRQELLTRVNTYIDSIPQEIFIEIEQSIMPLYFIRGLCFFDFSRFFRFFSLDIRSIDDSAPDFKSAAIDKVHEALENLYYVLYSAKKASTLDVLPPQLFSFVQEKRAAANIQERPSEEEMGGNYSDEQDANKNHSAPQTGDALRSSKPEGKASNSNDEGLRALRKDLKNLHDTIDSCIDKTCITEIIRFFNDDLYYRFMAYVPSINLKEFYFSSLRYKVLGELDAQYSAVRVEIIKILQQTVFPKGIAGFNFFQKFPFGEPRAGLHGFRFVQSLELLHAFMQKVYVQGVREAVRSVIKSLPNKSRDTGTELLFHTTGLESVAERLMALDQAFSPDSDEGKSFQRMKTVLERDLGQEKQFRIFVIQKDKENRELVEEGIEHIMTLAHSLEDVLSAPNALLMDRFSRNSMSASPTQFIDFLRTIMVKIRKAGKLIRYQRAIDDENF